MRTNDNISNIIKSFHFEIFILTDRIFVDRPFFFEFLYFPGIFWAAKNGLECFITVLMGLGLTRMSPNWSQSGAA